MHRPVHQSPRWYICTMISLSVHLFWSRNQSGNLLGKRGCAIGKRTNLGFCGKNSGVVEWSAMELPLRLWLSSSDIKWTVALHFLMSSKLSKKNWLIELESRWRFYHRYFKLVGHNLMSSVRYLLSLISLEQQHQWDEIELHWPQETSYCNQGQQKLGKECENDRMTDSWQNIVDWLAVKHHQLIFLVIVSDLLIHLSELSPSNGPIVIISASSRQSKRTVTDFALRNFELPQPRKTLRAQSVRAGSAHLLNDTSWDNGQTLMNQIIKIMNLTSWLVIWSLNHIT